MQVSSSIGTGQLQACADKCSSDLLDIVAVVRGSITKLQRSTLTALIVIDVHSRDVAQELANGAVHDETDYEWTSQLRYYLEDNQVSSHPASPTCSFTDTYLLRR
jgi:dynein heavy chain, axonemal